MSIQSINGSTGGVFPQVAASDLPVVGPAPASAPVTPHQSVAPNLAPTTEQVQEAVKKIAQVVQPKASSLEFSVDKASGRTVISVVDKQSGELIRQIPSEEILRISESIEQFQGLLGRTKA